MEQIRKLEQGIRTLVDLDERGRRTEIGERDPPTALRILKNHMKGSVVGYFCNDAARAYTVGQLTALHKAEGQWVTVASVFAVLRSFHMAVNGGQTELTLEMLDVLLSDEPARVMMAQARPALADRNGRGAPASPTKDELRNYRRKG
jgi:hypothetical protein